VAGPVQSCALAESGLLYCWDLLQANGSILDEPTLLGGIPPLVDFDLGDNGQGCGVDRDGKVLCWGPSTEQLANGVRPRSRQAFRAGARFVKVSAGFAHACALDDAGGVWCGGNNTDGELGTGDTTDHPDEMLKVKGLGKAIDVSAGVNNSCAVLESGEAWCWGTDSPVTSSKLLFESLVPIRIGQFTGLFAVHNGRNFMCGISARAVHCWGSNIMGQLGATIEQMGGHIAGLVTLPSGPPTSIGAGLFNACGTFDEGLVLCWGSWNEKPIFTPRPVEGLPFARAVSVNVNKACALAAGDQVWCWGGRTAMQGDPPRRTTRYTVAPWHVVIPVD